MSDCCDVVIAGASIIDIPVVPADASAFTRISTPADHIIMTCGGDALNEALILSRLGRQVRLISRIGCDDAGSYIKNKCHAAGIDIRYFREIKGLDTGVNVVLVDHTGERRFLTNRNGSLRRLEASDIVPEAFRGAKIFCFASIFVFPLIDAAQLEQLFQTVRAAGLTVCADMTAPKRGETVLDLAPALRHLDYLFSNLEEAHQITGLTDPEQIANVLLQTGVRHVIIKLGASGCLIADASQLCHIPACPTDHCVDTTGAGDNFAAGFLSALLDGKSFEECARYANACACVSVEAIGATAGVTDAAQVIQRRKLCYPSEKST